MMMTSDHPQIQRRRRCRRLGSTRRFAVWGSGRGAVRGFKVGLPMAPPKVPEPRDIAARARAGIDALSNARELARERLRAARTRRRESSVGSQPGDD